jgi:hypothetical protein
MNPTDMAIRALFPNETDKIEKWQTCRRNLEVIDIVLVCDENLPRGHWPLGLILKVSKENRLSCSVMQGQSKRLRKGETDIKIVFVGTKYVNVVVCSIVIAVEKHSIV